MFSHDDLNTAYALFGKNDAYSMVNQTGDIQPCCNNSYRLWLQEKFGLDSTLIDIVEKQLYDAGETYSCSILTDALIYHTNYKKNTYYSK